MCKVCKLIIHRFPNKLYHFSVISLQIVRKQHNNPFFHVRLEEGTQLLVQIYYGCSVKPKTK